MPELHDKVAKVAEVFGTEPKRATRLSHGILTRAEKDFILDKMKFVSTIDRGYGEDDQATLESIRRKLSR